MQPSYLSCLVSFCFCFQHSRLRNVKPPKKRLWGKFAATANVFPLQEWIYAKRTSLRAATCVSCLSATLQFFLQRKRRLWVFHFFCATKFAQRSKKESIVSWGGLLVANFWRKPSRFRPRRAGRTWQAGFKKTLKSHKTTNPTKLPSQKKQRKLMWQRWHAKIRSKRKTQLKFSH